MYFDTDVVATFLDRYGTFAEADCQLWRATAHGWHLYPVPLPRPSDDFRSTKPRSPNCAYGGS